MPVAVTLNTALPPVQRVRDTGWLLIAIISLTVNTAPPDVAEVHGAWPLTTTLYVPASVNAVFESINVDVVAPVILPPFVRFVVPFLHWYVKPLPVAVTLKLTDDPEHTDWLAAG